MKLKRPSDNTWFRKIAYHQRNLHDDANLNRVGYTVGMKTAMWGEDRPSPILNRPRVLSLWECGIVINLGKSNEKMAGFSHHLDHSGSARYSYLDSMEAANGSA